MRVLVCGSRGWKDQFVIECLLEGIDRVSAGPVTLINGGARGADALAREVAEGIGGACVVKFPADWVKHGKAAGPVRNQRMIDEGEPDIVVAFSDLPVTPGTFDMVRRAKAAGITTYIVSHA